ncbi:hypothetical protein TH53_06830 [Pedobacter lusitanus]|uniref:Phytanoyl-CoA dioxygenase n=1 Tax=Pedobacter lusitanus TaxID=1503925 RepID=A0A0D0GKY8_9SPHI|nr:phytanoyl-CoA dioxygenase family protein [Pedobacter lusitanus]KIO77847.1 hypothetical protein TH53_06830 [Pedobacter lusitanus]
MDKINLKKLKVLSEEDVDSFINKGYVIIRNAFSEQTAENLASKVWEMIPEDMNDRSTWTRPAAEIQRVIKTDAANDLFTSRYVDAIDDLLGEGRWHTNKDSFGWIPLRFPGFSNPPWKSPLTGWHVDGINFCHHLNSPEQGLAGMEMFSNIEKGGGGTALRIGSHKYIAQLLHRSGSAGISYQELKGIADQAEDFPVEEATGNAGDVLWMHPFLIHARSPNVSQTVRIAANRTISLYDDIYPLNSDIDSLSILEQSIRSALE